MNKVIVNRAKLCNNDLNHKTNELKLVYKNSVTFGLAFSKSLTTAIILKFSMEYIF